MKKRLLLIAVAGAIVVGCADEMLDTSYESVLKEAQLKGDHPLVFNAYVGNGMANTRASELSEYDVLTTATDMDDSSPFGYGVSKAAGVFGYYTGKTQPSINNYYGIYGGSTNYSASQMSSFSGGSNVRIGQANYLYNTKLYYDNGTSNWKTKVYEYGNGWEDRTLYWPTDRFQSTNEYVTFFAYYPHVDPYSSSYNNYPEKANLHITAEGQTNIPMLDYQVACGPENEFHNLDLMAAVPVIQDLTDNSTPGPVNLGFKHLLAAVSIKINYEDNLSSSGFPVPEFVFHKAEMQGANSNREITELTKFTKRGLFNLGTGMWYTRGFETLNLLGDTWLTNEGSNSVTFDRGEYYTLLYQKNNSTTSFVSLNSSSLSDIDEDNYMLIIPNSNQEKLKVNLSYSIKNGSYYENVDVSKDIDLQIKPGNMYQILLTIKKNQLEISASVDSWNYNIQNSENI